MKDKPLAIIITLLGGSVACICCIVKGAGLLWTLLTVLISLFVFMIIGLIVNRISNQIRTEVEEREKEELRIAEEAKMLEERKQQERERRIKKWMEEHPGEELPEDFSEDTEGDGSENLGQEDSQNL